MVQLIHSICLKGPAQVVFARIYISLGKYSHSSCDVSFAQYMFTDPQVLGWRQPRYIRPHRKQRQISINPCIESDNHIIIQSHVTYPVGDPPFFGPVCPPSHPVGLPVLFIEIVWDTRAFNDPLLWPKDGSQPFVLSMGDP